ncbi:MAG: Jag N-terminal domain-containing protein [Oscillospiraceae bacterium]|nr:Jag N-terminal domain-containing protein [Oscillospiraceae bacterium]
MIKSQVFTEKTVEKARELAAKTFGVAESDITFEILEEPKRGFLGITKGLAKVKATYTSIDVSAADHRQTKHEIEVPPAVEYDVVEEKPAQPAMSDAEMDKAIKDASAELGAAAAAFAEEPEEKPSVLEQAAAVIDDVAKEVADVVEDAAKEVAPAVEETAKEVAPAVENAVNEAADAVKEAVEPAKAETETKEDKADKVPFDEELIVGEPSEAALAKIEKAKAYLAGILEKMGVEATFEVKAGAESAMIDIVAANNGAVIGKRGETLDALQYLTFMIANRGDKEYYRIILNSANYRERRRKTLEELAAKIAKNVLRSGRQMMLEPMNPYERRIIHSAIAEIDGVQSKSIGEEPYRKVVISSTERPQRRGRGGRGERDDRGGRGGRGRDDRRRRDGGRRRNPDAPPERISMDSMKTAFEKEYKRPKAEDEINAGLYGKIEF